MYSDLQHWQSWLATWAGAFGQERVVEWFTNRRNQMAAALESFNTAIIDGTPSHSGDPDGARHFSNVRRSRCAQAPRAIRTDYG